MLIYPSFKRRSYWPEDTNKMRQKSWMGIILFESLGVFLFTSPYYILKKNLSDHPHRCWMYQLCISIVKMVKDCILNIIILKRKYKHTVLWFEKKSIWSLWRFKVYDTSSLLSQFWSSGTSLWLLWSANLFLLLSSSFILPLVNICWIIPFPYVDEWLWFDSWRYSIFS